MARLIIIALGLTLVGCSALGPTRDSRTFLFEALDTQPDGYVFSRGDTSYAIKETLASETTLCRVVEIDQPELFEVESFCKARGGLWR